MSNTTQTKGTNVLQKSKTKSRINRRQRNRRRNKQKSLNGNQNKTQYQTQIPFSHSAHTKGAEVWNEAYLNAVRWHGEHQNNFWRHAAEQLQNENQMLRRQLYYVSNIKPETRYETSDEDEDDDEKKIRIAIKKEEDEVDSKYLEFLQVTIKHREELRLKREAADILEEEDPRVDSFCG